MENFLAQVEKINGIVNGYVWGIPMLILIIGTGILMTTRTKFFQVRHFHHVNMETFFAIFRKRSVTKTKDKKAISQFQALSTALAATIGVGNIAGVASAILIGGPGAVFWMWLSAFFGMMTNYSENVLGIYYRRKNKKNEWSGGAMYYLRDGLGSKKGCKILGYFLAILFSIFCTCASFGIGNMTQVHEIASSLTDGLHLKSLSIGSLSISPQLIIGIVLAALCALVIIGGIKRIGQVTEKVVPFMALAYIVGTVYVLIINRHAIPEVFGAIFKSAFGLSAVGGGISGAIIKNAVTMGFKRGVFSNEAGLGSSVMVHSASDVKEPVVQGMWGIFEVFFDTIIVCTLTAFTVLSSGLVDLKTGEVLTKATGASVVSEAFTSVIGSYAGIFLAISITLFAFSTVLGWSFYGTKAFEYLFGTKATIIYKILFVGCIIFGATMEFTLAWDIADTLNGLMAIPNLIGVISLSGLVVKITENYVKRRIGKKADSSIQPILSAFDDIQEEHAKAIAEEVAEQK